MKKKNSIFSDYKEIKLEIINTPRKSGKNSQIMKRKQRSSQYSVIGGKKRHRTRNQKSYELRNNENTVSTFVDYT